MAEFDRRVPTSTELAEITEKGYGVGLRRIPRKHRDLRFLEDAPELQASWISGPVVPDRIPTMTGLTQLSLLSTGVDELNLSRLTELRYYEGPLRGHESVLSLPRVTELCFDPATGGRLDGIPRTVRSLILTRATGVDSLAPAASARHQRCRRASVPAGAALGGDHLSHRSRRAGARAGIARACDFIRREH